ncbi:M35 family metallo-endopeptidase [Alteromonas sp. a30]|uniref:M35 family metallo-endopeptidase n=1 Tax=Alteromonas sp. a30 TaxID=2730917 RepID=UPI00227DA5B2|nr:M35 family metallo-endopeptidase [Alteromonas sp. a30]MCY7294175.1 peptidase M35 [Alteromonas sp. a30]
MKTIKLTTLAASLLIANVALAKGIEVDLSTASQSITAKEDLTISVTFTNTESEPLKLLSWYIPTQDTKEALFKVKKDGYKQMYFGAHAKRAAPQSEDYIEIQPNESVSYEVELTGLYDLSVTGNYNIQYAVNYASLVQDSNNQTMKSRLVSKPVNVWVEGRGESFDDRTAASDITTQIQGISYTGSCSNTEKNTLSSALQAASSIANNSVSYLGNEFGNRYNARYDTWFGNYSSSRWNTVRNNFNAIKNAIDTKGMTFDCSCNQSYFAYVYPSQPYKVYFCNAFWNAPLTGTDSKAGTIIHELSHFNIVAGTDDIAYGQSGAKSLANSSPYSAIQNADSHEYFAENTPYQN